VASATLRMTRRRGGITGRSHPFEISVDGAPAGSVANGETVELAVPPGHHTLRVRNGRSVSPERSFEADGGEVVNFWTRSARLWPVYVASLVKPDLRIRLQAE
jgi:hypothetical protein